MESNIKIEDRNRSDIENVLRGFFSYLFQLVEELKGDFKDEDMILSRAIRLLSGSALKALQLSERREENVGDLNMYSSYLFFILVESSDHGRKLVSCMKKYVHNPTIFSKYTESLLSILLSGECKNNFCFSRIQVNRLEILSRMERNLRCQSVLHRTIHVLSLLFSLRYRKW